MKVERKTNETEVTVDLARGTGKAVIRTDVPFLNHMMMTLARYSGLDVTLDGTGDLKHHLIEDVAITFGAAFAEILPASCARYGERTVAMDDAVVQVIIDTGGRPFYRGPLPSRLYDHWMRSFADNARITLHIIVIRGADRHHVVEAAFKALGFALRDAIRDNDTVFSTKGAVLLRKS
jgi:imidazoleglycerol-phosphate dehydratase